MRSVEQPHIMKALKDEATKGDSAAFLCDEALAPQGFEFA